LNQTIESVTANMEKYEFSLVGHTLVSYIWDDFCSWYIELSKITLSGEDTQATRATQYTLYVTLESIVKLIHPFMPFVSEEIYQTLTNKETIVVSEWPSALETKEADYTQVDQLISMISTVRELRLSKDIKKDVEIYALARDVDNNPLPFDEYIVQVLDRIVNVKLVDDMSENVLVYPIVSGTLLILNEGLEDPQKEIDTITAQLAALDIELERSKNMLSNQKFLEKAKAEKVESERAKYEEYTRQQQLLTEKLESLQKV
jgi:valyl-tRNA synthetase